MKNTTKKISFLLALLILCATLSACKNDELSSGNEESKASSIQSTEDTSAVSEEVSEEISEDISEESSEVVDFDEIIKIPEGYKGHLLGDYFEEILDFEKGFSLVISCDAGDENVSIFTKMEYIFKGNNALMRTSVVMGAIKESEAFLKKGDSYYLLNDTDKIIESLSREEGESQFKGKFDGNSDVTIEFIKSYEKEEDGVVYVVEEYKGVSSDAGETSESIEIAYFKDGKLVFNESYGVRSYFDAVVGADDSAFDIPSDYNEKKPFEASDVFRAPKGCEDLEVVKALQKYSDGRSFGYKKTFESSQHNMAMVYEEMFIYADGKVLSYDKLSYSGVEIETKKIYKNGIYYSINFDEKSYSTFEDTLEGICYANRFFVDCKYVKTITEEIDGVEYTVDIFDSETYSDTTDDEFFYVKYYTRDGKLEFIKNRENVVKIEFFEESQITDDLFEIPEGFVEAEDETDDLGFTIVG